jgi:hypothetical protein
MVDVLANITIGEGIGTTRLWRYIFDGRRELEDSRAEGIMHSLRQSCNLHLDYCNQNIAASIDFSGLCVAFARRLLILFVSGRRWTQFRSPCWGRSIARLKFFEGGHHFSKIRNNRGRSSKYWREMELFSLALLWILRVPLPPAELFIANLERNWNTWRQAMRVWAERGNRTDVLRLNVKW